jgi:hypothetical protein
MDSMKRKIDNFMAEYFQAYNQYAQVENTQNLMNKFYTPGFSFDDGSVRNREHWYKKCLTHPAIQDKLTVELMVSDVKKKEVLTLLQTHAVERATGNVLLELSMCGLYSLEFDQDTDIKINKVKLFLESSPQKIARLSQLYAIS